MWKQPWKNIMEDYHIIVKTGGLNQKYSYSLIIFKWNLIQKENIKKSIKCRSYKKIVVHTFLIDFFYVLKYDECIDETNKIPIERG